MLLRRMRYLQGAAALLCLTTLTLDAQRRDRGRGGGNNWEYLGEAHVDGGQDHDNIRVTRSEGTFRAIKMEITGGPIEFRRVVVHFRNGGDQEIEIRDRIPAGGQTRPINLPGNQRSIQSVEIYYEKGRRGTRPKVSLYGR